MQTGSEWQDARTLAAKVATFVFREVAPTLGAPDGTPRRPRKTVPSYAKALEYGTLNDFIAHGFDARAADEAAATLASQPDVLRLVRADRLADGARDMLTVVGLALVCYRNLLAEATQRNEIRKAFKALVAALRAGGHTGAADNQEFLAREFTAPKDEGAYTDELISLLFGAFLAWAPSKDHAYAWVVESMGLIGKRRTPPAVRVRLNRLRDRDAQELAEIAADRVQAFAASIHPDATLQ